MNNRKEPWEEYPDVWATKAAFFAWLQWNIHKEVFCRLRDGWTLEEALGFVEKVKHG